MDDIRDRLLRRAYLYADSDAYTAGVEAALTAIASTPEQSGDDEGERDATLAAMNR